MSWDKERRKVQTSRGRRFPIARTERLDSAYLTEAIAAALRLDFGDARSATKVLGKLTGANQRAAKNWLGAKNSPSSLSLIELCRHSDRVFEVVMRMAGREQILKAKSLTDARLKLKEIVTLLDELVAQEDEEHRFNWPATPWADCASKKPL
jgi:hypothetical protein